MQDGQFHESYGSCDVLIAGVSFWNWLPRPSFISGSFTGLFHKFDGDVALSERAEVFECPTIDVIQRLYPYGRDVRLVETNRDRIQLKSTILDSSKHGIDKLALTHCCSVDDDLRMMGIQQVQICHLKFCPFRGNNRQLGAAVTQSTSFIERGSSKIFISPFRNRIGLSVPVVETPRRLMAVFTTGKVFHSPRVTSDLVPRSNLRNDDRGRDGARKPHCSVLGLRDPSFRPASSLTSRLCPQVIVPHRLLRIFALER
jgi:hypothetical protein